MRTQTGSGGVCRRSGSLWGMGRDPEYEALGLSQARNSSHTAENRGGPLPAKEPGGWGGRFSRSSGGQRVDFRAPSVRVAKERSQRKVSLGKPRGGQCRGSAVVFRVKGEKRARGEVSMLTGHGDGNGSGLPPLRPLVQYDVTGPAPFSQRNEVVFYSPPLRALAPIPIGQEETHVAAGHAGSPADEKGRFAGQARCVGRGFPSKSLGRVERK